VAHDIHEGVNASTGLRVRSKWGGMGQQGYFVQQSLGPPRNFHTAIQCLFNSCVNRLMHLA
jgi:hypothetical protein